MLQNAILPSFSNALYSHACASKHRCTADFQWILLTCLVADGCIRHARSQVHIPVKDAYNFLVPLWAGHAGFSEPLAKLGWQGDPVPVSGSSPAVGAPNDVCRVILDKSATGMFMLRCPWVKPLGVKSLHCEDDERVNGVVRRYRNPGPC